MTRCYPSQFSVSAPIFLKTTSAFIVFLIPLISMISWAGHLPDTGQNFCYDGNGIQINCPEPGQPFHGQDAQYLFHPRSYTKLDATGGELPESAASWSMVRDNITGLIWEKKTDDGSLHDRDLQYDLTVVETQFIAELNNMNFGGFSDWRMPLVQELVSIIHRGRSQPAIDPVFFPHTRPAYYSASEHYINKDNDVWDVDFEIGRVGYVSVISNAQYARAVRGGKPMAENRYVVNDDGTVTDLATGLMWQAAAEAAPIVWEEALLYCETQMSIAGYDDWRLPDINELQSLSDYSIWSLAISPDAFPKTLPGNYWSSTSDDADPAGAWTWESNQGGVVAWPKTDTGYVRAVRGGQNLLGDHLLIKSPEMASGWSIGSRMEITWETEGIAGDVQIAISRKGGLPGTFETIAQSTPNTGKYGWSVTGPPSINCAIEIQPLEAPAKTAVQSLFRIGDIIVNPVGLTISEPDGSATFTVRLGKAPTADVTLELQNTNPGECRISHESITLTSSNWQSGVQVLVTAEADGIVDGDQVTAILTGISSSADPLYDGLIVANVIVTVENIDTGFAIDFVYPTYGEVGTNPEVKIKGVNFDSNTVLYLYPDGGTPSNMTAVTLESPTLLTATLTDPGTAGSYTLEVSDGANSAIMPGAVSFADAAVIGEQNRKKAIIVAGSGPFPDNDLWLTTENLTKLAYTTLTTQGYTDESIRYLTLNNTIDITGDGQNDVDGPATTAELEAAIKTWAATGTDELILYMIGPGRSSGFQFGSDNDPTFLYPATLDGWLDELQTAMNGPVIIVYDACQSESFLGPLAGTDRTLITSTSSDERAWFLDDGEISFSGIFWNSIFSLGEIYDAFREAEAMMIPLQTPCIDTDGDGSPDTLPPQIANNRQTPDEIIVGRGRSVSDTPPEITGADVDPEVLAGGVTTAEMSAGPITDTNGKGISNVWARIITPLNQYAPADRPVLAVPTQKLLDDDEDGIYERSYDDFIFGGDYPIYIHAVDRSDLQSRPQALVVKQTAGLTFERGDLNLDGDIDLADVLIALKAVAGLTPPRIYTAFEVDGDGKIGLIEALYDLMKVAELQP